MVERDGACLGREPAGDGMEGGVALEQSERPGEKKLGEIKGPRSLLSRCLGASWRGSNGRYELTAFLQASGGGGGRWLH